MGIGVLGGWIWAHRNGQTQISTERLVGSDVWGRAVLQRQSRKHGACFADVRSPGRAGPGRAVRGRARPCRRTGSGIMRVDRPCVDAVEYRGILLDREIR